PPDNLEFQKTYDDITIVAPPCYDTLPTTVQVIDAENPGGVIQFNDVPAAETAIRAAVFKVFSCVDSTLRVTAGPGAPYSILIPPGSVTVMHGAHLYQEARIWFAFTGGVAGATAPTGNVTIHCNETGQDFNFTLEANTIARPTVAVMLILDQSGSMQWPAGFTGSTRIQVLHDAASQFVQLVQANNGVGMIRFDNNAYLGTPVQTFGPGPFDPNRIATLAAVQAITPNGATSIGNGITLARSTLDPVTGFDKKAMIVFTDGLENTSLYIADVKSLITSQTFAIGLGNTEQVSTGALTALTNGTGGYLLLSGLLASSTDDYFRISKYFLQVLAGVNNNSVVLDPTGSLTPGMTVKIPFLISDTDIDATVVLLTDYMGIAFDLLSPSGDLVTPASAASSGAEFAIGTKMSYYRFTLPLEIGGKKMAAGTWYAVLGVRAKGQGGLRAAAVEGRRKIRYSLNIHAFSNLRMRAFLWQNSLQPGATMTMRTLLSEYGVPVAHRATVKAYVQAPDSTISKIEMHEVQPGAFEATILAVQSGVYQVRVVATGSTWRGLPFTREQLVVGTAFAHGDDPSQITPPDTSQARDLCTLVECVLKDLGPLLKQHSVDSVAILACVQAYCRKRLAPPSAAELAQREGIEISLPSSALLNDSALIAAIASEVQKRMATM
ncbi:MAG: VWA domain-containing protein, partial [Steroidobacteraceae bacterium]